jgi:VanZ family protein
LFVAQVLPIDPAWVKKNTIEICNIGHLISCFILTCFGFSVFKKNYLKGIFCVAGLAVFGEFLQSFSSTRQANMEDIILSFAGILLASTIIFFIKYRRLRDF